VDTHLVLAGGGEEEGQQEGEENKHSRAWGTVTHLKVWVQLYIACRQLLPPGRGFIGWTRHLLADATNTCSIHNCCLTPSNFMSHLRFAMQGVRDSPVLRAAVEEVQPSTDHCLQLNPTTLLCC
jgi:hypothetical protein